jgi:DNA-binding response OmpR family regulator
VVLPVAAPRRVLVVEDDAALCGMLVDALTLEGLHAIGAMDGDTAIRSLTTFRPELVVTDLCIDGAAPAAVAEAYRASMGRTAPLLLLSGRAIEDVATEAARLSASGFLIKPFNIAELLDAVDAALAPLHAAA